MTITVVGSNGASAVASGGSVSVTNSSGNLILAALSVDDGNGTIDLPTNWVDSAGGSTLHQTSPDGESHRFEHIVSGPGSASYTFTYSVAGSPGAGVSLLALSGHATSGTINAISSVVTNTTANSSPVSPTVSSGITTTVNGCMLVMLVGLDVTNAAAITWTKPSGWDNIVSSGGSGVWAHTAIAWTLQASAGATGSISCTATGQAAGYTALLLAIAPDATATPSDVIRPAFNIRNNPLLRM